MKKFHRTLSRALRMALLTTVLASGAFAVMSAQATSANKSPNHTVDYHLEYIILPWGEHSPEFVATYSI